MRKLTVPGPLTAEFETVKTIWHSLATTRAVDAFVLAWVKYEKQLRRLFCYLVFRHLEDAFNNRGDVDANIIKNRKLYPEQLIKGIDALAGISVQEMLEEQHKNLSKQIKRINRHRNKLIHGQNTGHSLSATQIEEDVLSLIRWVEALANAADRRLGYDGLKRDTYRVAKSTPRIALAAPPFSDAAGFRRWLERLVR